MKQNKLIFVIDMLNGFCYEGNLASPHITNLVSKIKDYLEANKQHDNIFFCDAHSKDDIEMEQYQYHCLKNTSEAEIVKDLKPYVKTKIEKNTTNSFLVLDSEILSKYDEFIITGCCTDICILQFGLNLKTYLNYIGHNKKVIIKSLLVDTFDTPSHNRDEYNKFALKLLQNAGIIIE
ncbi:isochorismatase family protein [Metamycoplasma hyosynoviae]|uniref:isochorismatase family protein n=1 Tax=Metamycoplasma hyosynoviae TaxID=29559 RepID=UPI002358BC2C|nr:isochorismatase family protein [Metamycoplasma hyosynoviae]MDC8915769.1 isochorismatase family protein [Metamycoplasma hyosynoviae]MDC8920781.1 isochorismatase family protein [Metamycoplasma hyosynoviae]MDD1372388.1 isochorismatase family protein [Metamycoplasma hyosynoviae]MDD1372777.1 isochorismatase family protein [Metamycoplasma hyosynoviae]MDD7896082.1 isochorismatase family protein [Metamycoplasma hyosynoviae]